MDRIRNGGDDDEGEAGDLAYAMSAANANRCLRDLRTLLNRWQFEAPRTMEEDHVSPEMDKRTALQVQHWLWSSRITLAYNTFLWWHRADEDERLAAELARLARANAGKGEQLRHRTVGFLTTELVVSLQANEPKMGFTTNQSGK